MKYERYVKLYKRFLCRSPDELISLAGDLVGKTVLDLCTGGGRLALAASKTAALVIAVDQDQEMMNGMNSTDVPSNLRGICRSVEEVLDSIAPVDVVFCQQGVNYWFSNETVKNLKDIIVPGGLFIFNTFHKKPSSALRCWKSLYLEGVTYLECSWLVGDMVYHVQVTEGMEPDFNFFRWIPPEEFKAVLGPYFDVDEERDGATSLYRCVRKHA